MLSSPDPEYSSLRVWFIYLLFVIGYLIVFINPLRHTLGYNGCYKREIHGKNSTVSPRVVDSETASYAIGLLQ